MEALLYYASWACLLLGAGFCFVGGVGLLRLPDFYSRMHGGGVTETLGAGLILLGLMFQSGLSLATVKLVMIAAPSCCWPAPSPPTPSPARRGTVGLRPKALGRNSDCAN